MKPAVLVVAGRRDWPARLLKGTTGRFKAVAIVSNEMRPGAAMANFNFPASPANAVVSAVPDPMPDNCR